MKLATSERLAAVLEAHGLREMAAKARDGYYDDYRSPLATPIVQLVLDLNKAKRGDLARRAMAGEWDGTREEAEAWYESFQRGERS